jgi:hypothetical protein
MFFLPDFIFCVVIFSSVIGYYNHPCWVVQMGRLLQWVKERACPVNKMAMVTPYLPKE